MFVSTKIAKNAFMHQRRAYAVPRAGAKQVPVLPEIVAGLIVGGVPAAAYYFWSRKELRKIDAFYEEYEKFRNQA